MNALDADHWKFRQLAELYAQAVDSNRPELLESIVTADAVIEGPAFRMSGIHEIRGIPAMLREYYQQTRHLVHNQVIMINGDQATGETYGTADHLLRGESNGVQQILVWHLRYKDVSRKEEGSWLFACRKLEIDWTETRTVQLH